MNCTAPGIILPKTRHETLLALPFVYRLLEHLEPSIKLHIVGDNDLLEIVELAKTRGLKKFESSIITITNLNLAPPLDTIYCLDRSFRSGFAAWLNGAKHRVGFSSGSVAFFYTHPVATSWNEGHSEIEKNLNLLRSHLQQDIAEWDTLAAGSLLSSLPRDLSVQPISDSIVMVTFDASAEGRQWPVAQVAALCETLTPQGVEIWLVGDSSASALAQEVIGLVPSLLIKNLCENRGLGEQIELISKVDLVVSADLVTLYLACDLGVRVVGLLGNVLPDFGFAPWRRNASVLTVVAACRNCELLGLKQKPRGRHKCVESIAGDRVYREVRKSLYDSIALS